MPWTRNWDKTSPVGGTTPAKNIDDEIRNLKQDIEERMNGILGTSAWTNNTDPIVPAGKTLNDMLGYSGASANAIPRVSVASPVTVVNGSLTDDGAAVALAANRRLNLLEAEQLVAQRETAADGTPGSEGTIPVTYAQQYIRFKDIIANKGTHTWIPSWNPDTGEGQGGNANQFFRVPAQKCVLRITLNFGWRAFGASSMNRAPSISLVNATNGTIIEYHRSILTLVSHPSSWVQDKAHFTLFVGTWTNLGRQVLTANANIGFVVDDGSHDGSETRWARDQFLLDIRRVA